MTSPNPGTTSMSQRRRRTRRASTPATSTTGSNRAVMSMCALSLALLSTTLWATVTVVDAQCADVGERSQQCGATNANRPAMCCEDLTCDKIRCAVDPDYDGTEEEDDEDDIAEDNAVVVEQEVVQQEVKEVDEVEEEEVDNFTDDNEPDEVDMSDLAPLTNTPAAPAPTATIDDAAGASTTFSNFDLLRPIEAVNGLKPSGGIGSAVFGTRKSRTWDMLIPPSTIQQPDRVQLVTSSILRERDPFKFTEMPSAAPSDAPSFSPTERPSASPSDYPSATPTVSPTDYPTVTMSPTVFLWDTEPRPATLANDYFDYNPASPMGPNSWNRVSNSAETRHWNSLQQYIDVDLSANQCGNTGSTRQSPIDVSFDKADGQCFEYHEIRHEPGAISVADPEVDAQILPTKLRIDYPFVVLDPDEVEEMGDSRPFWTVANWETDDKGREKLTVKDAVKGPSADIPKGWGYQLPVTHVDIKVPSEHYMEGKQYAAEYQIYLIQNRKAQRGAPVISILIDLDPEDKPNAALQVALDRFQLEYDKDMAQCEARRRKERRLDAILGEEFDATQDQSTWLDEPEEEEAKFQSYLRRAQEREPQGGFKYFDPWDSEIMRSIYFFGYEGSLTEPPCSEFVEWRIMDTPATVSRKQLFQMKKLLFHHVDGSCKRTSTHYEGSVARPLQPYNGRMVHRCMCRDFIADRQRKQLKVQRCNWKDRDQWGFNKNVFTQEWYTRTHQYENPDHQKCAVFNDCADWNEDQAEAAVNGGGTVGGGGGTTTTQPAGGTASPWWWSF